MSERGMKKWLPYRSLTEQSDFLNQMLERKRRIDKPRISSERAEKINSILLNGEGKILRFVVYRNYSLMEITEMVRKIDPVCSRVYLSTGECIPLRDIVDLFDDGDETLPSD